MNFWTFDAIVNELPRVGCEPLGTSPKWLPTDRFEWYKNAPTRADYRKASIDSYRCLLPYLLAGKAGADFCTAPAPDETFSSLGSFIDSVSAYSSPERPLSFSDIVVPKPVQEYLGTFGAPKLRELGMEIGRLLDISSGRDAREIIHSYHRASTLRSTWGVPYHYLSFLKP